MIFVPTRIVLQFSSSITTHFDGGRLNPSCEKKPGYRKDHPQAK